jgi:hypothetical protein
VSLSDQVAVPAQYGVGSHDQSQPVQHLSGQWLEQRGEEGRVLGCEPGFIGAELPLQDGDLVAESEDLRILVTVAHREQTQHGEGIGHGRVGKSQQHSRSSCRTGWQRSKDG